MAIHTAASVSPNITYAASTRSSARFPVSDRNARRAPPCMPPSSRRPPRRGRVLTPHHRVCHHPRRGHTSALGRAGQGGEGLVHGPAVAGGATAQAEGDERAQLVEHGALVGGALDDQAAVRAR